jgi:ligand-binding sensor domain-containing protein
VSSSEKRFITYSVGDTQASNTVNTLVFAPDGKLWCNTDAGVYRDDSGNSGGGEPDFKQVTSGVSSSEKRPALADYAGRLWFEVPQGLALLDDGAVTPFATPPECGEEPIADFVEDRNGGLLIATMRSVLQFRPPDRPGDQSAVGAA